MKRIYCLIVPAFLIFLPFYAEPDLRASFQPTVWSGLSKTTKFFSTWISKTINNIKSVQQSQLTKQNPITQTWISKAIHNTIRSVRQFQFTKQNMAKIGIAAIAGYVLYRFIDYVRRPSVQSIESAISQAQEAHTQATAFQPLIEILRRHYGQDMFTSTCLNTVNADIINELAQAKHIAYEQLMRNIAQAVQSCTMCQQRLQNRMSWLVKQIAHDSQARSFNERMHAIIKQLDPMINNLRALEIYMNHYCIYFQLYDHTMAIKEILLQSHTYDHMIEVLQRSYGTQLSQVHIQGLSIDENILYDFAVAKREDINVLIQGLNHTLSSIEQHTIAIDQELASLQQPCEKINESLYPKIHNLRFLASYLTMHKAYFELYEQEVCVIHRYGSGTTALRIPSSAYPRITLIEQLEQDLSHLSQVQTKVNLKYPALRAAIAMLEANLSIQRDAITKSELYSQEQSARLEAGQRDQLIAAQQRQAQEAQRLREVQEATLRTQQQQVREMERYNAILTQSLAFLTGMRGQVPSDPESMARRYEEMARTVRAAQRTQRR